MLQEICRNKTISLKYIIWNIVNKESFYGVDQFILTLLSPKSGFSEKFEVVTIKIILF